MKLTADNATVVMENLDKGGPEEKLNFPDYMFLRRINLGWQKCAAAEQLSINYVPCGLRIAVPKWIADETIAIQISDLSILLRHGYPYNGHRYLDLMSYMGMAHIYYYFISF